MILDRIRDALFTDNPADAALITDEINRRYLTGFPSTDGYVLITPDKAYLLLDFRYAEAARRCVKDFEVVLLDDSSTLSGLVKDLKIKSICVESDTLTLTQFNSIERLLAGVSVTADGRLDKALKSLRMIKTQEEIKSTTEAQRLTDEAFSRILKSIRPGVTERALALELEFFIRQNGGEAAFEFIVVSGKNGSLCHGVPSDKKVEDGDFITMDFGARVDGYDSDMTRTVAVGHISDEQRHVYEVVLAAQRAALAKVRAGEKCADIDAAARSIIESEYSGAFGHGLGHGVGLEIHEEPRFSPRSKDTTLAGMIMTVEPGIYLEEKFGVRIEDMVLVTADGCTNFTQSPKELILL